MDTVVKVLPSTPATYLISYSPPSTGAMSVPGVGIGRVEIGLEESLWRPDRNDRHVSPRDRPAQPIQPRTRSRHRLPPGRAM